MPKYGAISSTKLLFQNEHLETLPVLYLYQILQGMKKLGELMLLLLIAAGCQKSDVVSEFTGNQTTYDLQQGSQYAVSGTVIFKERKDGRITAVIQLKGTEGDIKHPVHLHLPGADVALLMNPVIGNTGRSETTFNALTDESRIDYQKLNALPACIKIHLGDTGPARDIILAGGNIGSSFTNSPAGGRLGISVCKSE
jgi:hypothetical protein